MISDSIGIIGGFGGYATVDFFRKILDAFKGESEREYPHIYMDNDFTMPSRTKALLYGDDYEIVVMRIADSISKMVKLGATYIVMPCGTAHAFLPDVFAGLDQDAASRVINIVDVLSEYMRDSEVQECLIIAAEGTLKHGLYSKTLHTVKCLEPGTDRYPEIRYFMECVKRDAIDKETADRFIAFCDSFNLHDIVLGCTEFPVLVNCIGQMTGYEGELGRFMFWDPLEFTVKKLKSLIRQ